MIRRRVGIVSLTATSGSLKFFSLSGQTDRGNSLSFQVVSGTETTACPGLSLGHSDMAAALAVGARCARHETDRVMPEGRDFNSKDVI